MDFNVSIDFVTLGSAWASPSLGTRMDIATRHQKAKKAHEKAFPIHCDLPVQNAMGHRRPIASRPKIVDQKDAQSLLVSPHWEFRHFPLAAEIRLHRLSGTESRDNTFNRPIKIARSVGNFPNGVSPLILN